MLKKTVKTLIFTSVFSATAAMAGPFGIDMGMKLKDIKGEHKKLSPGVYLLREVPKPHSKFIMYAITASPKQGVCMVKAVSRETEGGPYGFALQTEFDTLEHRLSKTYGIRHKDNFLREKSIWSEQRDWMNSLLKKERVLRATWSKVYDSTLPDDTESIILDTRAESMTQGYLLLEYKFTNYDACIAEIEKKEDGAL